MLRSEMLRSMTVDADYFTPLARAVASMDRDAYAARFAVYDREHKALLRRLATAEEPCSDADVAREEQAFRDAIRRIEFADEAYADEQPALVQQDEPREEAPPAPRRAPRAEVRPADPRPSDMRRLDVHRLDMRPSDVLPSDLRPPEERPPEPETFDDASLPAGERPEPDIAVEPLVRLSDLDLSEYPSVARRVGVRLALAVLFLAAAGVFVWMGDGDQVATQSTSLPAAVEPAAPTAASNDTAEANTQPTWLTPEIFYTPPSLPSSAPAATPAAGPTLASAPRDIPLPVPRPER
jgi:hypothetical protein